MNDSAPATRLSEPRCPSRTPRAFARRKRDGWINKKLVATPTTRLRSASALRRMIWNPSALAASPGIQRSVEPSVLNATAADRRLTMASPSARS